LLNQTHIYIFLWLFIIYVPIAHLHPIVAETEPKVQNSHPRNHLIIIPQNQWQIIQLEHPPQELDHPPHVRINAITAQQLLRRLPLSQSHLKITRRTLKISMEVLNRLERNRQDYLQNKKKKPVLKCHRLPLSHKISPKTSLRIVGGLVTKMFYV